MFVRFASIPERDAAVAKLNRAKVQVKIDSKPVWARADTAVDIRACEVFLWGLKKLLVEWGFEKRTVRVEVEGPTKFMKVGGKMVVTTFVVDGELHCEWAEGWKVWEDLHQNEAFIELFKKAEKMVTGADKGKGKGKDKST